MPNDAQPAHEPVKSVADRRRLDTFPYRERLREWALTALLILECLVLFVATPVAATLNVQGPMLAGTTLLLMLILTIVIISRSMGARILASIAVMLAVVGASLRITSPSPVTIWLGHFAAIIAVIALSIVIARVVFGPGRVTHHRIQGAIVLYLNLAIAFTSAYRLVLELNPAAFTGIPAGQAEVVAFDSVLYFSFTTLTSTGYGEIVPINPAARSLSNLESITGQLYLAILLARLVTLHVERRRD
jgi:multisubunit Na+/H+ antiporter MnhF subunit